MTLLRGQHEADELAVGASRSAEDREGRALIVGLGSRLPAEDNVTLEPVWRRQLRREQ